MSPPSRQRRWVRREVARDNAQAEEASSTVDVDLAAEKAENEDIQSEEKAMKSNAEKAIDVQTNKNETRLLEEQMTLKQA